MGLFSKLKGKAKAPDPSKRKPGYGVAEIYPYLFNKSEAVIEELKGSILPYLSDEEEESIVGHFQNDVRSFRAFLPEDTLNLLVSLLSDMDKGDSPYKTFGVKVNHQSIEGYCCRRWYETGCCGGIAMPDHVKSVLYSRDVSTDDPRLVDYFIIDHINHKAEQLRMHVASVAGMLTVSDDEPSISTWG